MADHFKFTHIRALLNEEIKKYKALQKYVSVVLVDQHTHASHWPLKQQCTCSNIIVTNVIEQVT